MLAPALRHCLHAAATCTGRICKLCRRLAQPMLLPRHRPFLRPVAGRERSKCESGPDESPLLPRQFSPISPCKRIFRPAGVRLWRLRFRTNMLSNGFLECGRSHNLMVTQVSAQKRQQRLCTMSFLGRDECEVTKIAESGGQQTPVVFIGTKRKLWAALLREVLASSPRWTLLTFSTAPWIMVKFC